MFIKVHKGNWSRHLAAMFLMDQIRFSYFYRGSHSDHFCQIALLSEDKMLIQRVSYIAAQGKLTTPLAVMILNGSNFVEGRPVIISTKSF